MLRVSLRDIWSRKRRLLSTSLAVVLGVALLSGTLVLGQTLESNFDNLFAEANAGTDVVVRSATDVGGDEAAQPRGLIDIGLVDQVRGIDGVAAAEPSLQGYTQIIGSDGEAIGGDGPPTFGGNWIEDPDLNGYRLAEGRAPANDDEVVINKGAADAGGLELGATTTVRTPDPLEVTIVGIATFGTADGLGPSTFTAFTLDAAERHLTKTPGQVTSILVKGEPGVDADALATSIGDQLPAGVETITGAALTRENLDDLRADFLDFLRGFLLVFALIALLVATFSIHNTFSIIVAQRTRESALLRALGATRRQVLVSTLFESLTVGVVASAFGVVAGLGIAALLKAIFAAFGFALPTGGMAITAGSIITALLVGVVVTMVAGVSPAIRSSRVAPLEALRASAVERTDSFMTRAIVGAVLLVGGGAVVSTGAGSGGSIGIVGLGALAMLVGVITIGPLIAMLMARVAERPLGRLRGISGRLAAENAGRSPRRTSGTAMALLIGVGIVTLITVVAVSLAASAKSSIRDTLTADVVVSTGQFGGSGFSPALAEEAREQPEVAAAVGVATTQALIDGSSKTMSATDFADVDRVLDLDVASGSMDGLTDDQLAVSRDIADENDWTVGTPVSVGFADGATEDLSVGAIFGRTVLTGNYILSDNTWVAHAAQPIDQLVLVSGTEGVSSTQLQSAVDSVARTYGDPLVQTRAEYVDESTAFVDTLLGIVYVMLFLAIVIALMGIANTLSLSIHERVRELGLLRAVGQTPRQMRSMIRWESILVAILGTVVGLVVGVFFGWALISAASTENFPTTVALPTGLLITVLVVGIGAGLLAAIRPARRAGRLDVLSAIATE
jgi:putative ABC transport system permease protein